MASIKKIFQSVQDNTKVLIILGILLLINILSSFYYRFFDLTQDKRFLLTEQTKKLIDQVDNPIYIRLLLDGDFPAGFKKLQQSTIDILKQFSNRNGNIEFVIENPLVGSIEDQNLTKQELSKSGIQPINLRIKSSNENKEQLIYPYAIITYGERKNAINLLENVYGANQETNLHSSIALLEYKLANGIKQILNPDKKNVLVTKGNGELEAEQIKSLESTLRPFYNIVRVNLDSSVSLADDVHALIIVRPTKAFSERNKFIIDQYVMNGGRVLWFVDGMRINLDSFNTRNEYIPEPNDVNLSDLLFKYGVRIESNLVLDIECAKIPQRIGEQGGRPQIELFPWYFHPLIGPVSQHPIVRNIDRIMSEFPSSIDTVKTKSNIKKTALLLSSQYSRYQQSPTKVGFEILRYKPDLEKFDKPHLAIGYLLEGDFNSNYENRVEEGMKATLESLGRPFKSHCSNNKMIVVADGDILKNIFDKKSGKFAPMGYNKFEDMPLNGNKEFILNAMDYMTNDATILSARSKEIKMRLLNTSKAEKEKSFWQFFNIGLPLLLLGIFAAFNYWWRKRKYINT